MLLSFFSLLLLGSGIQDKANQNRALIILTHLRVPHLLGHFDSSIFKKGIYLFRVFVFVLKFKDQCICNGWLFQIFDQNTVECLKVETMVHLCIQLPHPLFLPHSPPQNSTELWKHLRSISSLSLLLFSLTPSRKDTVGLTSHITGPNSMLALCQPGYSIHNSLESPRTQILPSPWGGVCVPDNPAALPFESSDLSLPLFRNAKEEMKLAKVIYFFSSGVNQALSPQRVVPLPEWAFLRQ